MPEIVNFKWGQKETTPTTITPGSILLQKNTGNMFVDVSETERVQVKDDTKLPLNGGTMTGNIDMNNFQLTNLKDATDPGDAVSKSFLDSVIATVSTVSDCPNDLDTIDATGIYRCYDTETYTNCPTDDTVPSIIIQIQEAENLESDATQLGLFGSTPRSGGSWYVRYRQAASYQSWIPIGGSGGSSGSGKLPAGGSPNTILIGTTTSGDGAWTSVLPEAVVVDDGELV